MSEQGSAWTVAGYCRRCGRVVGTWHSKPECDAFYDAAYRSATVDWQQRALAAEAKVAQAKAEALREAARDWQVSLWPFGATTWLRRRAARLSAPQPADAPEGHGDACEACTHEWVAAPRRLNEPATSEVCVKCGETREVEA